MLWVVEHSCRRYSGLYKTVTVGPPAERLQLDVPPASEVVLLTVDHVRLSGRLGALYLTEYRVIYVSMPLPRMSALRVRCTPHTPARSHARAHTHARTHAHTHTHTNTQTTKQHSDARAHSCIRTKRKLTRTLRYFVLSLQVPYALLQCVTSLAASLENDAAIVEVPLGCIADATVTSRTESAGRLTLSLTQSHHLS